MDRSVVITYRLDAKRYEKVLEDMQAKEYLLNIYPNSFMQTAYIAQLRIRWAKCITWEPKDYKVIPFQLSKHFELKANENLN